MFVLSSDSAGFRVSLRALYHHSMFFPFLSKNYIKNIHFAGTIFIKAKLKQSLHNMPCQNITLIRSTGGILFIYPSGA